MADPKSQLGAEDFEGLLLFRGVDLSSARGLLEECSIRDLRAGEVLIHAGQPDQLLYLVVSGRLRVHLELDQDPVGQLKVGEVAGEVSLISGELTSVCVVADENSRVLVLDEETMWSLFDASPLASHLLFLIAKRLFGADQVLSKSGQLKSELDRYAVTDALTGFHNQRWLRQMLPRQMERSKHSGSPFCLMLFRLDSSKEHLKTFGQAGLDRVLYAVSRKLRDSMRPGGNIVRYEGDDFMVLLPDTDGLAANKVGGRLCRSMTQIQMPGTAGGKPFPGITMSYGVAELGEDTTFSSMISEVERDLHEAREL